jgi:predicted transposase/invertase (TIGR01784 family)
MILDSRSRRRRKRSRSCLGKSLNNAPIPEADWPELRTYEEERQMPYITSVEQIGYDRGIEEKTIEIALNMLKDNLPVETIARFTGLSIAQIQTLQGQVN